MRNFRKRISGMKVQHILHENFGEKITNEFRSSLLTCGTRTIDQFVEDAERFRNIARVAVAYVLSAYESRDALTGDIWHKDLFVALKKNVRLQGFATQNHLSIITFNYDVSLEQFMYQSIANSYPDTDPRLVAGIVAQFGIRHVYGRLMPLDWERGSIVGNPATYGDKKRRWPWDSSMTPEITWSSDPVEGIPRRLLDLRERLSTAELIIFLGFGFDDNNMMKLGFSLDSSDHGDERLQGKEIYAYCFSDYPDAKCQMLKSKYARYGLTPIKGPRDIKDFLQSYMDLETGNVHVPNISG